MLFLCNQIPSIVQIHDVEDQKTGGTAECNFFIEGFVTEQQKEMLDLTYDPEMESEVGG